MGQQRRQGYYFFICLSGCSDWFNGKAAAIDLKEVKSL